MTENKSSDPSAVQAPAQEDNFLETFKEMWELWQNKKEDNFVMDEKLSGWILDFATVTDILGVTKTTLKRYCKRNVLEFVRNEVTGELSMTAGYLHDKLFNEHFLQNQQMHIAALERFKKLIIELNWHLKHNPTLC